MTGSQFADLYAYLHQKEIDKVKGAAEAKEKLVSEYGALTRAALSQHSRRAAA